MTPEESKQTTIKYLQWNLDEIVNNIYSMHMEEEDKEYNYQEIDKIAECIKWVENIKINGKART